MNIHPSNVLFLDLESVPDIEKYKSDSRFRALFEERFKRELDTDGKPEGDVPLPAELFLEQGAFYAEFNRIVCVGIGVIVNTSETNHRGQLYVKALTGTEIEILTELARIINKTDPAYFCAHNGLSFDFPVLQRKFWMHSIPIPKKFNNMGRKTWEMNLLDTMTMWSLSEWKAKISLDRLAYALGLPSPKAETSGADVLRLFQDAKLPDIARYCQDDVVTLVNSFLRLTESDIAIYEGTDLILK